MIPLYILIISINLSFFLGFMLCAIFTVNKIK